MTRQAKTMVCGMCSGEFHWTNMSKDDIDVCKVCAAQNRIQQANVLMWFYQLFTGRIWWGGNRKDE